MTQAQPFTAPHWWRRQPLARRLLGTTLSLVLALLLLLLVLTQLLINHQSEQHLRKELAAAERVWLGMLQQDALRLESASALLAANHELRRAMGMNNMAAMEATLAREGDRVGAQITALLDAHLRLKASKPLDPMFLLWLKHSAYPALAQNAATTGAESPPWLQDENSVTELLQNVALQATHTSPASVLALLGGAPYQFVIAPVLRTGSQEVLAWVLLGFALEQKLAQNLSSHLDVHVALQSTAPNAALRLVFSTLPQTPNAMQVPPGQSFLDLSSGRYAVQKLALEAWGGELHMLLMRSQTLAVQPFVRLQLGIAFFCALVLLLYAWASWRSLRRLTQPLGDLERAAVALEQGRFDAPLPHSQDDNDVARLSRSFDTMRHSLAQQQNEIRRLAYRDRLTGLPNRQRFVEAVEQALQHQVDGQPPMSVLTLNLDRFKLVNEVMGYAYGDELLRAVAQRLRSQVAPEHLLARLGGDAFGILMPQLDTNAALDLARALLAALATGVVLNGQRVDVRASIGLAQGPRDAPDADGLVNRAEMAMRSAKRRAAGVLCFVPEHDRSQVADLSLLGAMRDGLKRGELQLYLQPKLPLQPGRMLAAEALLRWQHPTEGMIAPARFIPFAEQTGFISELTRWVIDSAAAACASWQRQGLDCALAVNVSARDLLDDGFAADVARSLQRHGVQPGQISLEITESALMEDPDRALTTLQQLADQGLELAIDDYGTGYSSLSYLKQLPVQTLKIDRAFVAELAQNERDAAIVQSTLQLAHKLGLRVVAEGVEDAPTLERLRAWGCDWAQGYHVARPMSEAQFAAWLKQNLAP